MGVTAKPTVTVAALAARTTVSRAQASTVMVVTVTATRDLPTLSQNHTGEGTAAMVMADTEKAATATEGTVMADYTRIFQDTTHTAYPAHTDTRDTEGKLTLYCTSQPIYKRQVETCFHKLQIGKLQIDAYQKISISAPNCSIFAF